jgi:hypothetical protein
MKNCNSIFINLEIKKIVCKVHELEKNNRED